MSFKQNVEQHLQHFAQSIGLGDLKLNEHDACGLCFDETMVVNMEYLDDDNALVFVASVRPLVLHDEKRVEIMEKMLALNLQHHSMQGAFLSFNNDNNEALIIRSLHASCDYGMFETALEKFVNTLEWCIGELDESKRKENNPINQKNNNKKNEPPFPKSGPDVGGGMGMMV